MNKLPLVLLLASASAFSATTPSESMLKSNPDLFQAINIAESYSGGYAFKAEREDRYGNNYYSVEISNQAGQPSILWIDMNQQRVLSVTESFATPDMIGKNSYWFTAMKNDWSIPMATAIRKAENMTGYSALRADYEAGDQYEVDLINSSGHELEIRIKAENDYGHD